jgi:hypothetical protein
MRLGGGPFLHEFSVADRASARLEGAATTLPTAVLITSSGHADPVAGRACS